MNNKIIKKISNEVFKVFQYFSFFNYSPTFDEIYTFLPRKTSKKQLQKVILNLKHNNKLIYIKICHRYILPQYSKNIKNQISKIKNSQKKLENCRFKIYINLLSLFPQIKLVGLSGSIAMMNAKKEDDIDLFIICAKNRLFTGRFIALVLAQILGLRRSFRINQKNPADIGLDQKLYRSDKSDVSDKVCLNLFFDERVLSVPKFKQTEYVAHEVLQMKSIINKNYTYEKFLYTNQWVLSFFPNAAKISNFKFVIFNQFQISEFKNSKLNKNLKLKIENLGNWLEIHLKRFQLKLIKKHQTTELITDTQLWFHPEDFGKKLPRLTRK